MNTPTVNLVILISGSGSNLQAIIDHIIQEKLSARISAVISDNEHAYGLDRARKAGIPAKFLDAASFSSKYDYETALIQLIQSYGPDLLVLAGFMRVLSSRFIEQFDGKIMNIHPSLLPKFKGLNTHQRAIEAGESQHGATVHFVTAELDGGPIIIQSSVEIGDDDDADTLQKKVLEQEHIIYSKAIQRFAEGKLGPHG